MKIDYTFEMDGEKVMSATWRLVQTPELAADGMARTDGCYYTNSDGEGVFFQLDSNGNTRQIIGTCQFSVCGLTKNGARQKIRRLVSET